ncbi:MAG: hypothetical protein JWM53_4455 [bacterium]|nr:hypothetical protein [bacterium]
MRASVVVGLLAMVAAGAQCKRTNGAYCDGARPCPSGFACDETARECHVQALGGGDMAAGSIDMAGCTCSGVTPICVANSCVSCLSTSDPDGACAMVSSSTPHCLTSGTDAGACVGCRDASDCSGVVPFCDATMHVCRGCVADTECASLVCDLTPGSTTHGLCVAISQVEYADGSAGPGGMGLTPTTPRQMIQDAINHAVGGDNRPYVHIAAGSYNENVGVNNKTIYLVGANGAIIKPTNGDALGAMGATGSLTVRNLVATAPNGNGGNCSGASFTAYRSQFVKSSQNGIYSSNCALLVDAVWVDSNVGSGIYIGAGDFQIFNSIITHNTNSGGFYQLATGTTTIFVNNTVADNSASGTIAGVKCAAATAVMVRNSILYNNKGTAGTAIGETDCSSEFCASDDVSTGPQSTVDLTGGKMPGFKGGTPVTADSYHLTATSPCRNEASPLYTPDHDFDFESRPQGMPDIGADETP